MTDEQDQPTPPLDYPDNAILTHEQIADWVGAPLSIVKLWPIPRLNLPGSVDRFSAREVRAFLSLGERQENTGPIAFGPEEVLTIRDLARWIQVSERVVKDWPLPQLRIPGCSARYSAGAVLRHLQGQK